MDFPYAVVELGRDGSRTELSYWANPNEAVEERDLQRVAVMYGGFGSDFIVRDLRTGALVDASGRAAA